jgi:colicin import membrane protein
MSRCAWILCGLVLAAAPLQGAGKDDASERARIRAERRAAEQTFANEEAQCAQRFAVNDCVADVRSRRRDAMRGFRAQELVLDEQRRVSRAAQRLQSIERKRIEAEARAAAPAPPAARPAASAASTPARTRLVTRARAAAEAEASARQQEAADRAAAAERRRTEAAADRTRIQQRIEQRAAEGKKAAAPLPVPSAPVR